MTNMKSNHYALFENRMCVLQGEPGEPGRSGQKVKKSPVDADETSSATNKVLGHLQQDGATVTNSASCPVRTYNVSVTM